MYPLIVHNSGVTVGVGTGVGAVVGVGIGGMGVRVGVGAEVGVGVGAEVGVTVGAGSGVAVGRATVAVCKRTATVASMSGVGTGIEARVSVGALSPPQAPRAIANGTIITANTQGHVWCAIMVGLPFCCFSRLEVIRKRPLQLASLYRNEPVEDGYNHYTIGYEMAESTGFEPAKPFSLPISGRLGSPIPKTLRIGLGGGN